MVKERTAPVKAINLTDGEEDISVAEEIKNLPGTPLTSDVSANPGGAPIMKRAPTDLGVLILVKEGGMSDKQVQDLERLISNYGVKIYTRKVIDFNQVVIKSGQEE